MEYPKRCTFCNTRFNLLVNCMHVICNACDDASNVFGCCRLCMTDFDRQIRNQSAMISKVKSQTNSANY